MAINLEISEHQYRKIIATLLNPNVCDESRMTLIDQLEEQHDKQIHVEDRNSRRRSQLNDTMRSLDNIARILNLMLADMDGDIDVDIDQFDSVRAAYLAADATAELCADAIKMLEDENDECEPAAQESFKSYARWNPYGRKNGKPNLRV